jgi:hypothetical protein
VPGVRRADGFASERNGTGNEGARMRQALVAGVVKGVSREAGAGTANLIYRHGCVSGCSGILFEKKI